MGKWTILRLISALVVVFVCPDVRAQDLLVSPTQLTLRSQNCEQTVSEADVSVTGISSPNVQFRVEISVQFGGPNWLTVAPSIGTTPTQIRVAADANALTGQRGAAQITLVPVLGGEVSVSVQVSFEQRQKVFSTAPVVAAAVPSASFGGPLAPGMIASAFGEALAGYTEVAEFVDGSDPLRLPSEACRFQILVDGVLSPLYFISEGQVNFQVPYETAVGTAEIAARRNDVESEALEVVVTQAAPSVFTFSGTGAIDDPIWVGSGGGLRPNPAAGQAIVFFVTGLGPLSPPVMTGVVSPPVPLSWSAVDLSASFGGIPGTILYQGAAPFFVGLGQVNVLVPSFEGLPQPRVFELRADGRLIATFQF